MSHAQMDTAGDGRYVLSGELTYDTVPELWRRIHASFHPGAPLHFDLSGVSRADSAGMALLIELIRTARRSGGQVAFEQIPAQLLAIAKVSDLGTVLSLSSAS